MSVKYDEKLAENYWSHRLNKTKDKMKVVLSYNEPEYVNNAYAVWEMNTIAQDIMKNTDNLSTILDIGSGWGRVSLFFAEKGFKVEALDISQEMLEHLKKEKEEMEAKTKKKLNVTIRHGSCEKLPFEDSSIDVVLMLGLLEHLPLEIRKNAIKEVYRVLKINGRAYFVFNNSESSFLQKVERYEMKKQDDSGYFVGLMNLGDMLGFLSNVGFAPFSLSSNYHQSLARHYLLDGCNNEKISENIMSKASLMDIFHSVDNKKIVDQYIFVAIKRKLVDMTDPMGFIINTAEEIKKMQDFMINSTKMFM